MHYFLILADYLTNPSHTLFSHPLDDPNNVLVTVLYDGWNYQHWKRAIEMALIGKNKLKFVLGEYAKPNSTSPFVDKWNRCNKMILDWIMHATIKNISDNIMFSSTPRDAWIELKQSYGQADGTRMFEIQRDLCSIS